MKMVPQKWCSSIVVRKEDEKNHIHHARSDCSNRNHSWPTFTKVELMWASAIIGHYKRLNTR